VRTEILSRAL